jgi:membrane protein YdbS with pleckstrin-like domain
MSENGAEPDADLDDDVEVWWGGYSPRTAIPAFVACLLATGGLLYVGQGSRSVPLWWGCVALSALLWLLLLAHWLHRAAAFDYRLTVRRLLVNRGFWAPPSEGVPLTQIGLVLVERRPLERLVGVGRLRVVITPQTPPVVLEGVSDPEAVAVLIRSRIEQARAREATA